MRIVIGYDDLKFLTKGGTLLAGGVEISLDRHTLDGIAERRDARRGRAGYGNPREPSPSAPLIGAVRDIPAL